eukprot:GHVS01036893.1.p1 GENE.GHVS01036893.1~~GHVS01036893.1.p1  ORF type:complete len:281 (-),score=43.23 GHVS01036893.1:234-1076(-)
MAGNILLSWKIWLLMIVGVLLVGVSADDPAERAADPTTQDNKQESSGKLADCQVEIANNRAFGNEEPDGCCSIRITSRSGEILSGGDFEESYFPKYWSRLWLGAKKKGGRPTGGYQLKLFYIENKLNTVTPGEDDKSEDDCCCEVQLSFTDGSRSPYTIESNLKIVFNENDKSEGKTDDACEGTTHGDCEGTTHGGGEGTTDGGGDGTTHGGGEGTTHGGGEGTTDDGGEGPAEAVQTYCKLRVSYRDGSSSAHIVKDNVELVFKVSEDEQPADGGRRRR